MTRSRIVTVAAVLALACMSLLSPLRSITPVHAAQTLTVVTTADTGACPGASCSLRGAINRANADGSGDTITFNIPSTDPGCYGTPVVCHIDPATDLPPLTANNTTIDGYSQPGSAKNTLGIVAYSNSVGGNPSAQLGNNADIRIQLEGGPTYTDCLIGIGLEVRGHFNTVQGLSIVNFCDEGIHLIGTGFYGSKIQGNFIGVPWNGKVVKEFDFANYDGICAESTAPGYCNVIDRAQAAPQHPDQPVRPAHPARPVKGAAPSKPQAPTPPAPAVSAKGAYSPFTPTANQLNYPVIIGGLQNWQQNIVSDNYDAGIDLGHTAGINVEHNLVGPDRSGMQAVPNGYSGVLTEYSSHLTIGGPNPQYRNIISGNEDYLSRGYGDGVDVWYDTHVTVAANFIGTTITGTGQLANAGQGVYLYGGANNTVGLSPLGSQLMGGGRNLISGNYESGVESYYEQNPIIQYNWIGTDASGNSVIHNDYDGIYLVYNNYETYVLNGGTGTTVTRIPGQGAKVIGNLISGQGEDDGVEMYYDFYDVFRNNRIGTNYRGTNPLGNDDYGLYIYEAYATTIGGTGPNQGNLISATIDDAGIQLEYDVATKIQGNKIGTDLAGDRCMGNGQDSPYNDDGINVYYSYGTLIGGDTAAAANVIACSSDENIYDYYNYDYAPSSGGFLFEPPASLDFLLHIKNNWIGTNGPGAIPAGTLQLGAGDSGIYADYEYQSPDTVQIVKNHIAYNDNAGVTLDDGSHARISQNSIYRNGTLGIDLDANSTVDCPQATSNNALVTCPIITGATPGQVHGTAQPGAIVEVFIADNTEDNTDAAHLPDLYGEGMTYLGSATTGPGGNWSVSIPSGALSSGQYVTATATLPRSISGNGFDETSEFSKNVKVS